VFEFIVQAIIGTPQVILSKEILIKERFNPRWRIGEDMELWLRLARYEEPSLIENQATVVAVEHEERSVNIKKYNSGKDQLTLFTEIFAKTHSGKELSSSLKRRLISNCNFNISRFQMHKGNKIKSIYYLVKSIMIDLKNEQFRHRIYCLAILISFKLPTEYQLKT